MRTLIGALLMLGGVAALFAQGDILKPGVPDLIKLSVYADNWCMIFINGKLVAVNSVDFLPHNEVTANILPDYPMTIAILAKDNADPVTGLEYGNHIGDGGLILKMGDGTISDAKWKTKVFFKGPLNSDITRPTVQYTPVPANWFAPDFDDSGWENATVYTADQVKADGTYAAADFTGASFIWSGNLNLDNTIVLRYTVQAPKGYVKKWNTVPDLNVKDVFSEMQLAPARSPNLFTANAAGLGVGYVTRVRDGQASIEQFAQVNEGAVSALPIDLGPDTDQIFLTLLGSNIGNAVSTTALIGGVATALNYAGAQGSIAGLAQFVIPVPRSLAGQGNVAISIGKSNTVNVTVR